MSEQTPTQHESYMRRCIELARVALERGDTPVGSIIVRDNLIVAEGIEAVKARCDVTAHAEIEALRAACQHFRSICLAARSTPASSRA